MPFDGRLISAVTLGVNRFPPARRERVHVDVDRPGLGGRDDEVDQHRRLAELLRVRERERAARRLRVHEHRRDHEHRDAEHQLAADRPTQAAHVGVRGRGPRADAARPARSRPPRSASPGGARARSRRLHAASASNPMNTRDLHEQEAAVGRVRGTRRPTNRPGATPRTRRIATITMTLVERDRREVVGRRGRASGSRSITMSGERREAAEPDAHRERRAACRAGPRAA